jgi:hypothetical protein
MEKNEKLKKLDDLLMLIDAPKEGAEVIFTIKGDSNHYRGIVQKKARSIGQVAYTVVPKGRVPSNGIIETIHYKNRIFNVGGNK